MRLFPSRIFGAASLALVAGVASAQTFTVSAGLAPNRFFGSPSYNAWEANFMAAIQSGADSAGDLSSPTGYENVIGETLDARLNHATEFQSWKGQAPYTVPGFEEEVGNRLTFGVNIVSETRFSLATLEQGSTSSVRDAYGFDNPLTSFSGFGFGAWRVGIDYVDGIKGNGNDLVYDEIGEGNSLTGINEISFVSWSIADDVTSNLPGLTDQEKIDLQSAYLGSYSIAATYRVNGGDLYTSAPVNFQAVPEPATMAALGLGAAALLRRRRKSGK